jgi:hypothetical protein
MSRDEITGIIDRLRSRQTEVSKEIMSSVGDGDFDKKTEQGFTVMDVLRMWGHEIRSHHRDLIMARGRLIDDNPHFHVPHFVREANEEFGRFIGELSALSDDDLDRRLQPDGRTIRELAEHVLAGLEKYYVQQVQGAIDRER